jgi:hypothetical protein
MAVAGCDLGDGFVFECTTSNRDWDVAVVGVTGSELPVSTETPAGDCAIRDQRTRMGAAGCDLGDCFVFECAASNRHWGVAVVGVTGSKLPVSAVTPAGDCAVRDQRTRMAATGCDLGDCFVFECTTSNRHGNIAAVGVACSKLPISA